MAGSKGKKSTSGATQTTITPASVASTLSAFSPLPSSSGSNETAASYYAHLHRAPDAHTLRVYEVSTGKCISRHALGEEEGEKVTSLEWTFAPPPAATTAANGVGEEATANGKRGKKRRKSDASAPEETNGDDDTVPSSAPQPKVYLALGLENGSILLWHPNGSSSTTLSHPTSTSSITALSTPVGSESQLVGHLWSAHADGSIRVWDLAINSLIGKAAGIPEATPWDDLAVSYLPVTAEGKKRHVHLLLSHLTLHLFDVSLGSAKKDKVRELKSVEKGRCTGHVGAAFVHFTGSSAASLSATEDNATMSDSDSDTEPGSTKSISFLSYSPTDRFVQIWSSSLTATRSEGVLLARLGLDSPVQFISLATSPLDSEEEILAAIDESGKISLARLPLDFPPSVATPGKKGKSGVIALEVESEVTGRGGLGAGVARVGFTPSKALKICRGGVKPVFEVVPFTDENGTWIARIELEKAVGGLLNGTVEEDRTAAGLPTRYAEPMASTVRSGDALAEPGSDDELDTLVNSGELDVDMAEPTLADRLKALKVSKSSQVVAGDDENEDDLDLEDEEADSSDDVAVGPTVPATTLTTTLIQALHSADSPLLESCLAHGQPTLIRATVKRLPSGGLVLSLLEALVERLAKGKKGSQSSASVKRAKNLIEWVRQVLVVHVGFLVTIPSLVTRLAALHASLTSRLALQPTLLALSGRLELVVSQIDLRQERVAARAAVTLTSSKKSQAKKYVEGESSDEEESGADMDGVEEGSDDEGSVEDVVLGNGQDLSGEEDDEDLDKEEEDDDEGGSEEDDEEEEEDNSEDEPKRRSGMSAFLDLEASEESGSEGEEESEEDEDSE